MKYNLVYTKNFKNSFSNIGQFGDLKIVNIMNILQDIAVEYAIKLKISSRDLAGLNLFWVISRYQIEINGTAKLNEDLKVSVFRSAHKKLYDLRWFKIETASNKEVVKALGAWVIINKKTGSPCHLDKFMTKEMLCENTSDVKTFFHNLEIIKTIDHEHIYKIRTHDLDLNQHVNNSSYVEWAVESLPEEIHSSYAISKVNAVFLKESFYPGFILSKTQINRFPDSINTIHSIIDKKDSIELARLNITWNKI